ncbi:hypothetical protein [Alkalibacillus haloalkaliphilus]|uniref:Uncharacterized protein n=1 Tax=Alkalibacillus haloalkaliphilus TaxID=94136 RepID=A0A511W4Y8_9BACI|nr:hypothetical protein [Alkalibacillus haloalkaliphilus]GEN44432.1 hypothetical protein AHA02nite_02080 [Alkalibacillus haloalkaliphilus]
MASRQLIIPGGLLLGMGIGMLFGETGAGMFIGIGLGMLISVLLTFSKGSSERNLEKRVAELEEKLKVEEEAS